MAAKNKAAPAINMYGKNSFIFFIVVIFKCLSNPYCPVGEYVFMTKTTREGLMGQGEMANYSREVMGEWLD